jgi:hypothetical protein
MLESVDSTCMHDSSTDTHALRKIHYTIFALAPATRVREKLHKHPTEACVVHRPSHRT